MYDDAYSYVESSRGVGVGVAAGVNMTGTCPFSSAPVVVVVVVVPPVVPAAAASATYSRLVTSLYAVGKSRRRPSLVTHTRVCIFVRIFAVDVSRLRVLDSLAMGEIIGVAQS